MFVSRSLFTAAAASLALSATLMAGGFHLIVGNPEASPQAKAAKAVFTVKAVGCADPAKAELTATATGFIDGKRQTIPVRLARLDDAGFYAVSRQWPAEGKWVVQVTALSGTAVASILIPSTETGVDRARAKLMHQHPTSAEVDALLH